MEKPRHIISTQDTCDIAFLAEMFAAAAQMERDDVARTLPQPLRGRLLATLFYEPSTRTRLSFEAAMQKLGGGILTVENAVESSSAAKGETIADTIRVVGTYADAIAIRHFQRGSAAAAAAISPVPVINAGDGVGEHPTQALMDIYTIQRELGRIDGVRVALVGDLLNGRTIHSLLPLLALYKDISVELISPVSLRLPAANVAALRASGVRVRESDSFDGVLTNADVVYSTRVQRERFDTPAAYDAVKDSFILNASIVDTLQKDAIVMHALPRVNEIDVDVDSNVRAAYFRQVRNGLYMRMALLAYLLA
jgi:aspartate carbamoyltransferase catalytic subunit